MTKMLVGTCQAGAVKVDGDLVTEAVILSKGIGASSGALFIDGEKVFYIPNNSADLETTLTKVIAAINKIATTLTSIGAGMTGPTTAPPPTLVADVLELTTLSTELSTLKGALK